MEITIPALGKFGTLILHGNKTIYGFSSKVLSGSECHGQVMARFFFVKSVFFLLFYVILDLIIAALPFSCSDNAMGASSCREMELDVKE